jgi:hypothetical protein
MPNPDPKFAVLDGAFDGFIVEGDKYEFPTGAAEWAGVANTNTTLYPMSFPNGGEVRFKAATPPDGMSTQVFFKFEANPYPNNNPSFDTATALVSGDLMDYTLEIPAQDAAQEYNSFLMYIVERDQPVMVQQVEVVAFESLDSDDDGVPDDDDAFPNDPAASVDTDGDGMPDDWNEGADDILISESTLTLDDDDDNDGYTDEEELAEGTDPANAESTPFVPGSVIRLLLPVFSGMAEEPEPVIVEAPSLLTCSKDIFGREDCNQLSNASFPVSSSGAYAISQSPKPSEFRFGTYFIETGDIGFRVVDLRAEDQNSIVSPYFTGLSDDQALEPNSSTSFSINSPPTNTSQTNLIFYFRLEGLNGEQCPDCTFTFTRTFTSNKPSLD